MFGRKERSWKKGGNLSEKIINTPPPPAPEEYDVEAIMAIVVKHYGIPADVVSELPLRAVFALARAAVTETQPARVLK